MKFRRYENAPVDDNDDLLVINNNKYDSYCTFEGKRIEEDEIPYQIKLQMEKMEEKLTLENIVNAINEINKRLVALEKDKR